MHIIWDLVIRIWAFVNSSGFYITDYYSDPCCCHSAIHDNQAEAAHASPSVVRVTAFYLRYRRHDKTALNLDWRLDTYGFGLITKGTLRCLTAFSMLAMGWISKIDLQTRKDSKHLYPKDTISQLSRAETMRHECRQPPNQSTEDLRMQPFSTVATTSCAHPEPHSHTHAHIHTHTHMQNDI